MTWHARGMKQASCPARFELGSDGRDVVKLPDLHGRADRQPVTLKGQTHGSREAAEVRIEVVALFADEHDLAGLIGSDDQ